MKKSKAVFNPKGKGNDLYQTPDFLFNQLDRRFNFTLDGACTSENCKVIINGIPVGNFYDKGIDGLSESWDSHRVFVNPPFSQKDLWMEKAHKEVTEGNCPLVVMILPTNSMDTECWHNWVFNKHHYEIIKGRVRFIVPETGEEDDKNVSGTTIVYFWKKPTNRPKKKD